MGGAASKKKRKKVDRSLANADRGIRDKIYVGVPVVITKMIPSLAWREYATSAVGSCAIVDTMLWGQTQQCKVIFPHMKPMIRPFSIDTANLTVIDDAMERGWFWRWEYLHRTGWRHYSLEESFDINAGVKTGKPSLELSSGGKLSRTYTIFYRQHLPGCKEPHTSVQVSRTSGVKRAVRRRLFDCTQIDPESVEGWKLRWSELSPDFVIDMHMFSHDDRGCEISPAHAKQILDENVQQRELVLLAGADLAQICYVLDATGSMAKPIDAAKSTIKQLSRDLIAQFEELSFEFGCVAYRDFDLKDKSIQTQTFVPASNVKQVEDFLGHVKADGGDDIPEDLAGGLQECLKLRWRPGAIKIIVIITDAPVSYIFFELHHCHDRTFLCLSISLSS